MPFKDAAAERPPSDFRLTDWCQWRVHQANLRHRGDVNLHGGAVARIYQPHALEDRSKVRPHPPTIPHTGDIASVFHCRDVGELGSKELPMMSLNQSVHRVAIVGTGVI